MRMKWWKRKKAGHYTAETEEFLYCVKRKNRYWTAWALSKRNKAESWQTLGVYSAMGRAQWAVSHHTGLCQPGLQYEILQDIAPRVLVYSADDTLLEDMYAYLAVLRISSPNCPQSLRAVLSIARDEMIDLGLLLQA